MKAFLFIFLVLPLGLLCQSLETTVPASFRSLGPDRGGRCTSIEGVEDQENVYYAGYTGSGLWKTEDYGETWKNISDGFFESPSIGAIEVYQEKPQIIYVGTGTDGLRSNLIEGKGMYKSIDGGKKWSHIGLQDCGQIGSVNVHPSDPDVVYVAAIGRAFAANEERGVFKTTDGGESWEKVLFISEETGFSDIEFHPSNPEIIYATAWKARRTPWTIISGGSENGIYKSADAGKTWKKMDKGLPQSKGKIDLAVSRADPERLYALVEAEGKQSGLYRTDDGAATFTQVSSQKGLLNRPFYYCNLYADPTNAAHLYSLATRGFESHDGGKTWKRFNARHGDHHDIWINPKNPNLVIESNDGGANVSMNGGTSWSTQFNQATSEIYQVEVDNQYPYWVYGGQQDNYTTVSVPSLPPYGMQAGHTAYIMNTGGCETGPAVPHPTNPNIVYSNCKGKFSRYNKATGGEQSYNVGAYYMYGHDPKDLPYRFQRVAPIHISPHNSDRIYHCSQFVHMTMDEGKTWTKISPDLTAFTPETQGISGAPFTRDITGEEFYSTIYSIQESKIEEGVLWVGANDGPVHVSKDGGGNWQQVSPKDLPPGGRVDAVEASVHKKGRAYIAVLRYLLGDSKPYIFRTEDYGNTWKLITSGIPNDVPVRVVREDPVVQDLLYAGTEGGLYVSTNGGDSWEKFQKGLPIVPITDMKVQREDLAMSTMGRGFWVLEDLGALRESSKKRPSSKNKLYSPSDRYTYLYSTGRNSDRISTNVDYPSPGVNIPYYLEDSLSDALFLQIRNEADQVVYRLRSIKGSKDTVLVEEDMNTSQLEYKESKSLKKDAGSHVIRWNMRHASKVLASPGRYKISLTSGAWAEEVSFQLMADPRITKDGFSLEDFRKQEEFAVKTADLLEKVEDFIKKTDSQVKDLEKMKTRSKKQEAQLRILKGKLKKLKNQEGIAYPRQMYLAQLKYLFGMCIRSYQHINEDMMQRYEDLHREWVVIEGLE